jgi:hypothetical protein
MNSTQPNKAPSGNKQPQPSAPSTQNADAELPDDRDTAEETVHESRTSQDRDHTIRRGDNTTGVTKEFPT